MALTMHTDCKSVESLFGLYLGRASGSWVRHFSWHHASGYRTHKAWGVGHIGSMNFEIECDCLLRQGAIIRLATFNQDKGLTSKQEPDRQMFARDQYSCLQTLADPRQ